MNTTEMILTGSAESLIPAEFPNNLLKVDRRSYVIDKKFRFELAIPMAVTEGRNPTNESASVKMADASTEAFDLTEDDVSAADKKSPDQELV